MLEVEIEFKERLRILQSRIALNYTSFFNPNILKIQRLSKSQDKILYLSQYFMQGWNLSDFFTRREDLCYLK